MASQNKRKVGLSFTDLLFCGMNFKNIISNLEILAEGWHDRHVEVVGLVVWGGLGEGPELVLVVLRTDQGGDHGQGSLEGSVGPGVDQDLVGQGGSVTGSFRKDLVASACFTTDISKRLIVYRY